MPHGKRELWLQKEIFLSMASDTGGQIREGSQAMRRHEKGKSQKVLTSKSLLPILV